MSFYDEVLDRTIPWESLNEKLAELNKFGTDFSAETVSSIVEVKTLMTNGIDEYHKASENVHEWAGLVTPLLNAYIGLFHINTDENTEAQNYILLQIIDDCISRFTVSQEHLHKGSHSFNEASSKLTTLRVRIANELKDKSTFIQAKIKKIKEIFGMSATAEKAELRAKLESFYNDLKQKLDQASKEIDKTGKMLDDKIHHFEDVKVETQRKNEFTYRIDEEIIQDAVIQAAQELISKCDQYRRKHIEHHN